MSSNVIKMLHYTLSQKVIKKVKEKTKKSQRNVKSPKKRKYSLSQKS